MTGSPGPLMLDLAGPALAADEREMLAHPLVGGVILFSRNYAEPAQLAALTAGIRDAREDILIAADYEGGRVQRFRRGFTRLPPMRALGQCHAVDPERARIGARAIGWLMADELGVAGIDLPLAPVLDLDYGRAAVIGDRALARDPAAVADLAACLRAGLNAAGACATGKHFPGHGAVLEDSHEALPEDDRDESALAEDIAPFAQLIAGGLESVMMAHIRYPAVDPLPASLSRTWIGGRLRGQLKFAGAVFCDDLSMAGAAVFGGYLERAEAALEAGCDILPVCNNPAAAAALLDNLRAAPDSAAVQRRLALHRRPRPRDQRQRPAALERVAAIAAYTGEA